MNLTLVVDEDTIERAREAAQAQGTSLNALVRRYLERLAGKHTGAEAVASLELHWQNDPPGRSEPGWRFDREDLYRERLDRYSERPERARKAHRAR